MNKQKRQYIDSHDKRVLVEYDGAYSWRVVANTPEAGGIDEYDPRYHGGLVRNLERVDTIHPNG